MHFLIDLGDKRLLNVHESKKGGNSVFFSQSQHTAVAHELLYISSSMIALSKSCSRILFTPNCTK